MNKIKKSLVLITLCCAFLVERAAALAPQDYAKYFKIDVNAPLPSFEELAQKYANPNDFYDRKYDFGWNISEIFDEIFRIRITANGKREKRIPFEEEELLLNMLENVPKEIYPYIGPYMHTVPGMPERILNLPGIKETKNKFPDRIAPQLADIPDLEFLSPSLYFILMPEAWPQNLPRREIPNMYPSYPKVEYNADFYKKLKKLVPVENFFPDSNKAKKITRSDFRTLDATQTSLLTAADVKAFADTLDDVREFANRDNNFLNTYNAGIFLDMYEVENGTGIRHNNQIKDQVNPCQRLIQKIKILGKSKENEFQTLIGKKGFTLETWAYTCDKTIKAYRVSKINRATIKELNAFAKGLYMPEIKAFNLQSQNFQMSTIQGILEMYKAPMSDVLEVKKNRPILDEKFKKMKYLLVSSPIAVHY